MNKRKCTKKKSYGNTIYIAFKKNIYNEAHGIVIDLLVDMGFESHYLTNKIDISFESIKDMYIPLFTEFGIVNIFIGGGLVHLVFHFKDEEKKKNHLKTIKKYFEY